MALALEVGLNEPYGPPAPGEEMLLEVVVADGARPAPGRQVQLLADRGRVIESLGESALGRYHFRYRAPAVGPDPLRIVVDGVATPWELPVVAPPEARVEPAKELDAVLGGGRIELRFGLRAPVDLAELELRVTEGRVEAARLEAGFLVVELVPEASRLARLLVVGVADRGRPGSLPAYGVVRLRARQQATITAEPGSSVQIRLAGRSYGPFVADDSGKVEVAFDVPPGVGGYEIVVQDDLGNTQRVQSPLPAPRPALLALPVGRTGVEGLVVGVWSSSGAPWAGAAPECRAGEGPRSAAAELSRGIYRFSINWARHPVGADLPVACTVGDQASFARVLAPAAPPARVALELWPEVVSTDFPIAQVQVVLFDSEGGRLPPAGVTVHASPGSLVVEPAGGAWRATWRGDGSAATEATFQAEYRLPPGSGPPWELRLWAAVEPAGVLVRGRVLDSASRPLVGVEVELRRGDGVGPVRVVSDAGGWVSALLPRNGVALTERALEVLEARVGPIVRRLVLVSGAGSLAVPDPTTPDLVATGRLVIQAGRVRQVYLDASPRPLPTGAGDQGTISVRLLDDAGLIVADEVPRIRASAGTVGPVEAGPDGAWRASYLPPEGVNSGIVQITAESGGAAGSTDLELVPRPVRGSVGIVGGWTTNLGSLSSPTFGLVTDYRVPRGNRAAGPRLGVHVYELENVVTSDLGDVVVRATVIPIDIGVMLERRGPRRVLSVGAAGVVAPFRLQVDYEGITGVQGTGVFAPGVQIFGSGALRLGGAELVLEGRYLLLTAPAGAVRYQGSVGGATLSLGYRLLY